MWSFPVCLSSPFLSLPYETCSPRDLPQIATAGIRPTACLPPVTSSPFSSTSAPFPFFFLTPPPFFFLLRSILGSVSFQSEHVCSCSSAPHFPSCCFFAFRFDIQILLEPRKQTHCASWLNRSASEVKWQPCVRRRG